MTDARQAFVRRQAKSIQRRRETLARNMAELQDDIYHWNRTHPDEQPIVLSADLTADVKAMRNACPYCEGAGGRGEKCAECNPEGKPPERNPGVFYDGEWRERTK